jgi:cyclopropane fatty-acyl-phospholipid synthase-like methyltransferase
MEYFKNEKHVSEYIKMIEGYDGRDLIEILKRYLKPKSTVLELGMGPGKDLDILGETYKVTGSDYSEVFINRYKKQNETADVLVLDARTLETDRKFDCIYSNKVLIHLTKEETKKSLLRQKKLLNEDGILFHSFWKGDREENMNGLRFVYYTEDQLIEKVKNDYEVLEINSFKEFEDDDSIYMILKKI